MYLNQAQIYRNTQIFAATDMNPRKNAIQGCSYFAHDHDAEKKSSKGSKKLVKILIKFAKSMVLYISPEVSNRAINIYQKIDWWS